MTDPTSASDPAQASEPTLFFVVGRGRSGTTLLAHMLGGHPAIAVAPEGFFVANLEAKYGASAWDEPRITDFCRDLLRERRMASWHLPLPALRARLRALGVDASYRQVCEAVYLSYAQDRLGKRTVRALGDKNPHYALLIPRLRRRFPRARFIHVVRDPRDNVASYKQVPFDLRETHALAQRWRLYNELILSAARAAPGHFARVRYEDLVREPQSTMLQLCAFLGVSYDPAVLHLAERQTPGFYGLGQAWHARLQGPLDSARVGVFTQHLRPEEVAAVEHICAPLLQRLGYDPRAAAASPSSLGVAARAGVGLGTASVWAERVVFAMLPASLRIGLINAYRKATGRA